MRIYFLSLLSVFMLSSTGHADSKIDHVCELGAKSLLAIRSSAKPWDGLLKYYQQYVPKCDDGSFAEATSDLIMSLLANWKDFRGFKAQIKNENFLKYVLKSINGAGAPEDIQKILENTKKCGPTDASICKKIHSSAEEALKEVM